MDRLRKAIRYSQLRRVMSDLGYQSRVSEQGHLVFSRPGRSLFVILLNGPDEAEVRPIDLLSVQKTLINDGLIRDDRQFTSLFLIEKGDRLILTDPRSKSETEVVAASGETNDGLVIIKQEGALMTCPVDRLRPVEEASVPIDRGRTSVAGALSPGAKGHSVRRSRRRSKGEAGRA